MKFERLGWEVWGSRLLGQGPGVLRGSELLGQVNLSALHHNPVDPNKLILEAGYIFLVPPKGHQVYTLTNIKKEPYIHSPKTGEKKKTYFISPQALGFRV